VTQHAESRIPRDAEDDYSEHMAETRRAFARDRTQQQLTHLAHYSLEPRALHGNIENFIGVAQVPIGLAGPLHIRGEHARGDFYVPLATTEGALVASFNRGMRLLGLAGGVKTTLVDQAMQRCPVFIFEDAIAAKQFGHWVDANLAPIAEAAERTTHSGKLIHIQQFAVGPLRYLRFNYTTADAAGQNLTSKATQAACSWIREHYPQPMQFMLSGNMETDKKHSHMNMLHTRGRRVIAEVVLPAAALRQHLGVDAHELFAMRQVSNAGAFLAGASNNGLHFANGLTALFIATGQDVADIAESHAGVAYTQLLPDGSYYWSITLSSLIVATYGGGTGLPTQRECLELLGCYGAGKVDCFAEICAAVVLAGEISLAGAVMHGDWVNAHEQYGRNRP